MQNRHKSILALALGAVLAVLILGLDRWTRATRTETSPSFAAAKAPAANSLVAATVSDAGPGQVASPAPIATPVVVPSEETAFPVDDALPAGEVLAREEVPLDGQGLSVRRTLLKTGAKYPLVLVEDRVWHDGTGGPVTSEHRAMVADHVIVRLLPGSNEAQLRALLDKHGAQIRRKLYAPDLYLASFPARDVHALSKAIEAFSKEARTLAYAEPDWVVHAVETIPNDTGFSQLWAMKNTGQTGGTPGADIKATLAWDQGVGNRGVKVGVIDTGADYTHADLWENIWINAVEFAGIAGVDDDGNGLVDDVHGYDFAYDDGDPMDGDGHGTHTSGTIGATGNNSSGVVGVCWQVTIVPIKFLDDTGSGYTSDAVNAVYYATDVGCRLTSNSWGGGGFSQSLYDAIADADSHGILFVAAAGNSGWNMDKVASYPAGYSNPNIISVAATDHNDQRPRWSNYGATTVDLGAPGVGIVSSLPGDTYASYSGTSMATPHVAGAAALLWSIRTAATHAAIKQKILASVDPVTSLSGRTVTGGRLNLYNTVSNQAPVVQSVAWANPNPVQLPSVTTTVSIMSWDPDDDTLTYAWSGPAGVTFDSPTEAASGVALPAVAGPYLIEVTVSDGNLSVDSSVTVNVVDASPVPAAPSNLTATAVSNSQINLSWTDNSDNENDFRIERKTGSTGTWSEVATVGANANTYSDTGLSRKTSYYYRVRAHNADGYSGYSNEADAATPRR